MNNVPPSPVWAYLFACLYLVQWVRFGTLSMLYKNVFASRAMNIWSVIAYVPIVLFVLNPDKIEQLRPVLTFARAHPFMFLCGALLIGEFMIRASRAHDITLAQATAEKSDVPVAIKTAAQKLECYGHAQSAVEALRRLIRLSPSDADALVHLAALAGPNGKYDEAATLCRKALDIEPNHAKALFYLGLALRELDETEASRDALHKALKCGLSGSHRRIAETYS